MNECVGDHYNIQCPHCSRTNHYVDQGAGVRVPEGGKIPFEHPCFCCKTVVYYLGWRAKDSAGFPTIVLHASVVPYEKP
jgi:hypothetical protein